MPKKSTNVEAATETTALERLQQHPQVQVRVIAETLKTDGHLESTRLDEHAKADMLMMLEQAHDFVSSRDPAETVDPTAEDAEAEAVHADAD